MSASTLDRPSPTGGVAFALVRGWVRIYTLGMTSERRERRRTEIESDLWENREDRMATGAAPATVSLELLGRCLRGVPADLLWRYQMEGPAMNIHFSIDRVAGALLLGMVLFLLIASSIGGYDPANGAGFDGELRRAASVPASANMVFFTLSGIGLIAAAAGLTRAFRDRSPMLAHLSGVGLAAAGTLTLVSTALYGAFASLADDYVASEGAVAIQTSANARTLLLVLSSTNAMGGLLAVMSIWGLALLAAREKMVPGWIGVFPLISAAGAATAIAGFVTSASDNLEWLGSAVAVLAVLLWLIIAGAWIVLGGNAQRDGRAPATFSA